MNDVQIEKVMGAEKQEGIDYICGDKGYIKFLYWSVCLMRLVFFIFYQSRRFQ